MTTLADARSGATALIVWDPNLSGSPYSLQWDGKLEVWDSGASTWDAKATTWGEPLTYWH